MEGPRNLTALMSADLASLIFLVLLAMITTVSFGTPDPAQEFLLRVGQCLEPDAPQKELCDSSILGSATERLEAIAAAPYDEQDDATRRDSEAYTVCASAGPAEYTAQFDTACNTHLRVELDFSARVLRLPDTFPFNKTKPAKGSKEALFLDHVVKVISAAVVEQKFEELKEEQFPGHPGLANTFFDLLVVEGHADHIVRRLVNRGEQPEVLPYDYNVKLGMTRARYLASQFDELSFGFDIVVASIGCHRPLMAIGPIGDSTPARDVGSLRHDRACFREEHEIEDVPYDDRTFVRPSIVGEGGAGLPARRLQRDNEKEIRDELARNRRVEIRMLFKVGKN
ncbi:MAG: hypothetical protein AAF483_13860 [Planctomycetota bacterium]